MKYYTAQKNNYLLKFEGKWMDLENIILNEVTQTQKTIIICNHSKVVFKHKARKISQKS